MLLSPLAYLLSGPLADGVFEPATHSDAWSLVAPLVGSQAGAGIGLMAVIAGTLVIAVTAAAYLTPSVRTLEATLPDYVAVPAENTGERLPADRSPVAERSA